MDTEYRNTEPGTAYEPGLVWSYSKPAEEGGTLTGNMPPEHHDFRWLHLNLSDRRSLHWLEQDTLLPAKLLALMQTRDRHQHFAAEGDTIGLVLRDFQRGLDVDTVGHLGSLHVALAPGLLITGRTSPLHCGDLVRAKLEKGADIHDAPSALALLIGVYVENLSKLVLDLTNQLLDAESNLLADDETPDTRELIAARRRSAQLHRMIGGLRTTLQRMEAEADLPPAVEAIPHDMLPRLAALEADVVNAQQQLRMLRDELDLEASQRTNQNVYLLSILTALMMPATLVTGFFGMNTGGLPFAQAHNGTLIATFVALFSGALSYWLLKIMGLIRQK